MIFNIHNNFQFEKDGDFIFYRVIYFLLSAFGLVFSNIIFKWKMKVVSLILEVDLKLNFQVYFGLC